MLSPYRVLDLTDEHAQLAGLLLAQLGADVIAVEPPEGNPSRHLAPFVDDIVGPDRSLHHIAYNRGKRSVRADRVDLAALAATADVLLHSGPLDLDLDALRFTNPKLITIRISAFGDTGPKSEWLSSDLTIVAASGHMMLNGDSDRAPVRISAPQAFHHAALEMAIGAVVALIARPVIGAGQHLDVSAQQSIMQATQTAMLAAGMGSPDIERHAGGVRLGGYNVRLVYPAKDGYVAVTFLFGEMIGRYTQKLMHWVWEEGHCSEAIRDLDYPAFFELFRTGQIPPETLTQATDAVAALTSSMTKDELFAAARAKRLLIAPISNTKDLLGNAHLEARGYWDRVAVGEGTSSRSIRVPGPWAHATATPLRRLPAAPTIGQNDFEIAKMLSRKVKVTTADATQNHLSAHSVVDAPAQRRALDGLRVLDFTWVIAGPMATRLLADHGATIVRVESERRVDVIRAASPFLPGKGGIEDTGLWHSIAAGKHSLQLDLSTETGREVARDLARWADVVVESFAPGFMAEIGLDYESIRRDNPSVVFVSSALMGQTGPLSDFAGFGNLAASIAGFTEVTGWGDRAPAGPYTAYTDYVSPRFLALSILAAADHARRTGVGQFIDLSQSESAVHLLTPAILEQEINGRVFSRIGNADPRFAPHGVYAAGAPGADEWIAIACTDDAQWSRLAGLLGRPELATLSLGERLNRSTEFDALITAWTAGRDTDELQTLLQLERVPAHQVQRSAQCIADPQLAHREHFRRVTHAVHGDVLVEGPHVRYSVTQPGPAYGGPTLGQHTMWVLETVLGYDEDRVVELVLSDVLR
jgi:crotonobetainyl-CoA:carnitine CoA-transferase CaiB-like acyl-CoA transferase